MGTFYFTCQLPVEASSQEEAKKIIDQWKNDGKAPPEVKLEDAVFRENPGGRPGSASGPA